MSVVRFALIVLLLALSSRANALDTEFTYQGFLEDGSQPANGEYDLQFRLLDDADVEVGGPIEHLVTPVVRGVFTVPLDFGNVFDGLPRRLEIGVRPGGSADAYTVLTPDTPITTVPYAQMASVAIAAETATVADDVVDNAIHEVDIDTSAVSSRNIASSAVGNSELAADAVTASKIASGAVGNEELASNAVSLAKVRGAFVNGTLTRTEPANSCTDFDVTFGGDVKAGDFPLLAFQAWSSLPDDMSITALRVPADNLVEIRVCNSAGVPRGFAGLQVLLITLR